MTYSLIRLDPDDLSGTLHRLADALAPAPDTLDVLRRIVALYPHDAVLFLDETQADVYRQLALADKFTFDLDTDTLIVFSADTDTLIDALIEMAMYLSGFATMMGNDEAWVIEFTAGAWKPVKNRIKRQLDLPVNDKPRGVVGLPPAPDGTPPPDPYPFRTLVSAYDRGSFEQMVLLAARDEVAVYFPPEAHPKVLAAYVYMRRAMQEIAQGVDLHACQTFNERLIAALRRMDALFSPGTLPPAQSIAGVDGEGERGDAANLFGLFTAAPPPPPPPRDDDPFAAFIEQLFSDDDTPNGDSRA